MILDDFGMRLATFVDLGRALGVKTNQVYMWHQRRDRNNFPESVMHRPAGNGAMAPWFDLDEVIAWHADYVPNKGGGGTHKTKKRPTPDQTGPARPRLITYRQMFGFPVVEWAGARAGEMILLEADKQRLKITQEIQRLRPGYEPDTARFVLEIGVQYLMPAEDEAELA